MKLQPSLCSATSQIESRFQPLFTSLLTPGSSILSTTGHDSADEVDSDGGESEGAGLAQEQQHEGTVAGEEYREQPPEQSQSQSQLQASIVNQTNQMNVNRQEGELTPESSPSSETLVDDQLQPQPQPITHSTSNLSPIILLPSTPTPPSHEILIRYFYPIDPVTSMQQQVPVYDDPQCPAIKPIPEWPPPELVEWRKRSIGRPKNGAGTKRKANIMSSDEDDYSSFSGPLIKRVRWKSVDDVSFFESIPPITVNLRNKPFVSLPVQGPVDGTLYRPISISPFTPPPEEDEESSFGRGKRRRAPNRMLTVPVKNTQNRKPLRVSISPTLDDDFKPQPSKKGSLKPEGYRTCHQCRRSEFGPPKPKMKCSFIKPNGNHCVHQYCGTCIINRYDEPFAPSLTAWTCPVCREICNCSLCLRKQGFGYIWDGALANELKHKRLRHRIRLQDVPKNAKSTNGTIYDIDKPSMCKWLARRGVVTGSAAWMAQRRKEGSRFVVGRSPSPEPDSSIFVGDSEYVAEFEKMAEDRGEAEDILCRLAVDGIASAEPIEPPPNNDEGKGEILDTAAVGIVPGEPTDPPSTKDEGEGEILDTAAVNAALPVESTDPPSGPKPADTLPSPSNAFDVFAQSNLPKGHFFVGKIPKRKTPRSDSQVKHKHTASLPRRPRNVLSTGMNPDDEKNDAQCVPQPMMILRPPSKTIGFYARNEDLSEEETDSTEDVVVKEQVQGAVVHDSHPSDEDAEGTSDDGVGETHWPVQPQDGDNLPGPSLIYSTPPSTCTSNFTTLYTPTSSYTRPPSPSRAFQLLLGVPLTEQGYSLGLNARGLELEKHNMSGYMGEGGGRENHIVGRSPDRLDGNVEIANGSSVDDASKGLEKTSFDPHIIRPTQDPLNPSVDEYTIPLSPPLPIPGYDDTLKGIYDSSGFDTWFTTEDDGERTAENPSTSGTL